MRHLRLVLASALTFVLFGLGVTIDGTALAVSPPAAELCAAVPHISCSEGLDVAGATDSTSEPLAEPTLEAVAEPSLGQLVGQKLMVTMQGRKVSPALAGRVRRGEIGGVILLGRNVKNRSTLRKLTRKLQRTAANAGQPPLLIAIDQEGGSVRRVPWAPPTISIPEIGRIGSASVARVQGARTGSALRSLGINVDLAPVADIPRSRASFMLQQGRTFSFDASQTTRLANAFASGLGSRGVFATMKHFPGIGLAIRNTDRFVDTIRAPKTALKPDLRPYRRAIANGIPMIMMSNATYTSYDRHNAAGWSRAIADGLLRDKLGFEGVSITDSLNGTANARGVTVKKLALRSARAGTDMILVTGSERSTSRLYAWLLRNAQAGAIPLQRLRTSHDRILTLKERL